MLEHTQLLIGPWQADADAGRVRWIRDSTTTELLGLVRPSSSRTRWWRVWSPPSGLDVCETDDRALLMSLTPCVLSKGTWVLRDCDNNEIGKLRGHEVLDPWSEPFASRFSDGHHHWQMREIDGRVYATCATGESDSVSFVDPTLTNPFLRMLVIASFLLLRVD